MEKELELLFHDTVPLAEEDLPKAREKAARQKEIVLDFFRQRFSMNFTPAEVFDAISLLEHECMLLTSIRRSITDLTKEGKLIKCQWSESKPGAYGKLNRVWRYNLEWVKPLNPVNVNLEKYDRLKSMRESYIATKHVKFQGIDFTVKKLKSF